MIYGIGIIETSKLRDSKLSNLFSEEDNLISLKDVKFIFNKHGSLISPNLVLDSKKYKTYKGSDTFIKRIDISKPLRLKMRHWDGTRFVSEMTINNEYSIITINITKEWNEKILESIRKVETTSLKKITKLKSQLV